MKRDLDYVKTGWPKEVPSNVQPYVQRQIKLSTGNDCLLWGTRVVISKSLQHTLLKSLQDNHQCITHIKALARSYFRWIDLDKDIKNLGKSCESYQANKSNPTAAPLHPWVWPDTPWTSIHVDYAGPFLKKMFFTVADVHCKWPEELVMSSTTSQSTIEALCTPFGRYRLPKQLVFDNSSQFISSEFVHLLRSNRVKHIQSAP